MKIYQIDEIDQIINDYRNTTLSVAEKAKLDDNRAFGGILRSEKGKLVERICRRIIEIAWKRFDRSGLSLDIVGKEFKIPLNQTYLEKIKDKELIAHIKQNISDFYYSYKPDIVTFINNRPVIAVECKAYTENAMFKRILVDFTLLRTLRSNIKTVLFQLESQLGGDYSCLNDITYGSPSTHTLLSYFDIDMYIITMLKGERKVDRPIHNPDYFKPLTRESIIKAIETFEKIFYNVLDTGDGEISG